MYYALDWASSTSFSVVFTDSHIYFFSPPSKIEQQDQVLARQINTFKRKVRGVQKENKSLQDGFIINAKEEDPHYEYELVDNGEHCDSDFGFQNEGPGIFALRLQPN